MSELTRNRYDPLLQVQKDAYRCGKCMLCKWIDHQEITDTEFMALCPSGARFRYEAYYASGRQEIARGLLEGTLEYSDRLLHVLFTCTECGGCQVICADAGDKNPLKTIVALRERAFRDELAPLPEHETLIKSMDNYDNPWQQPRARRGNWMKRMELTDARSTRRRRSVLRRMYGGVRPGPAGGSAHDREHTEERRRAIRGARKRRALLR